jgi:SPX domain protein involved in polyphosphate accumulation
MNPAPVFAPVPDLSVGEARQEIKFVARGSELEGICHYLRLSDGAFSKHYPDRLVNSVYYDSFDYRAYAENLSGVSERNKLRYRWYGPAALPQAGTLELKCKRNHLGWKFQSKISTAPSKKNATWRQITQKIRKEVPSHARLLLDFSPQPVLINRYHRRYFISADGKIRATVDTQQAVYDQRHRSFPNITQPINHPDLLILEYKFAEKDRGLVSRWLGDIPLRRSRHSKYVVGLLALTNY